MNYMAPNFDIHEVIKYNNLVSLDEVDDYLDFALGYTINKNYSGITYKQHCNIAKHMILHFMNGDSLLFTRESNIRSNMDAIGTERIKNMLIKSMIEKEASNIEQSKLLVPVDYVDKCTRYITESIKAGKLSDIQRWIDENLNVLVENYVDNLYAEDKKKYLRNLSVLNPTTERALEQLNLEMRLQQYTK